MTTLPMKTAIRRWGVANLILWPIYTALMFWVFEWVRAQPDFADWPTMQKLAATLSPVAPLIVWFFMLGRFIERSPDEMGRQFALKAAAKAGVATAIALFAHGLAAIALSEPMALAVNGYDFTSFAFIGVFIIVFVCDTSLSNLRAIV